MQAHGSLLHEEADGLKEYVVFTKVRQSRAGVKSCVGEPGLSAAFSPVTPWPGFPYMKGETQSDFGFLVDRPMKITEH
jgi:hypothetical protein